MYWYLARRYGKNTSLKKQNPGRMQAEALPGYTRTNIPPDGTLVKGFSYTPGMIQALEASLSAERLTAYLRATGSDRERALRLYLWNTEISAALYAPLRGLEVALRNALHRELSRVHGPHWYDAPAMPLASRAQALIRDATAAIAQQRKPVIPPRVVAELSFGFWVSLLGPGPSGLYEMRLWRPILHKAFPNAKLPRKDAHHPPDRLRLLRNRIAHHEPIFTRTLADDYQSILQTLAWICADTAAWVSHHSAVPAVLAARP